MNSLYTLKQHFVFNIQNSFSNFFCWLTYKQEELKKIKGIMGEGFLTLVEYFWNVLRVEKIGLSKSKGMRQDC